MEISTDIFLKGGNSIIFFTIYDFTYIQKQEWGSSKNVSMICFKNKARFTLEREKNKTVHVSCLSDLTYWQKMSMINVKDK